MSTDAPTVSRHSIILALQLALARGWRIGVGDIRAAFLNGLPAPRNLYFRQPKRGIPSLVLGQLIEVLKGVFGLSTNPKLWWMKLSADLCEMEIEYGGDKMNFRQNEIDPCVFMLSGGGGDTRALLLTHVDDIMLMAEAPLLDLLQEKIKAQFPIDEWENDSFEYVGCEYECQGDAVKISQKVYSNNRVEKVTIKPGDQDEAEASPEQREENRTAIGCLSWLASRPGQTCSSQYARPNEDSRIQRWPTYELPTKWWA